ncbi:hypothetical protein [Gracilibacillus phocaeensis]|uniref:hypothetical protein n=1 Tax=Gracilibacillus phocaeensis TaxID=2042304 RepID=UPI00103132F7|nr:hypothetical protein [Gracilibacillus phocaeensis]
MPKRMFLLCFIVLLTGMIAVACGNQEDESGSQGDGEEAASSQEDESDENNQADESNEDDTQNDNEVDSLSDASQGSNGQNDSGTDASSEENQGADDDDNASASTSNSNSSSNSNELPATIEINEQVQHEDGITLTLEQIAFEEDHITVDFNAENQSGFDQTLASAGRAKGSNLGGITLQDDTGYDYRYVADDDSDRIQLEDQEKVTGTISFAGRIQEDAQSLTLIFNPNNVEPQFDFEDIEIEW